MHEHHPTLFDDLKLLARRQFLYGMAGASLIPIVGCVIAEGEDGSGSSGGSSSGGGSSGSESGTPTCATIPQETAGPYPGDGTNGANALALAGIVRSDIRSSLGDASGVADGVPLTVTLTLVSVDDGCTPLAGYAIYLWHCDQAGNYSMYSAAAASENYLRGVQETDANGQVTFTTIFPACYSGRMPHIHFEIYESLTDATNGDNAVHISQLAMPLDACNEVFATSGYEQSVGNLSRISFESDNVFSDGVELQLPEISGDVDGYAITLPVGIVA